MSISSDYSLSDIAAVTDGNRGNSGFGWGGDWSAWIIIFLIFAAFGGNWGGNGLFGGGSMGGAAENYVLASDFATIQRQLSDGFNSIDNALDRQNSGICDLGYTQAQLINGVNTSVMQGNNAISAQLAQCCCDLRSELAGVNYNMATQSCATLTAIDKVGDRIIDYISSEKMQTLRDENQALRLAASQAKQNEYLISQLGYQCPKPAYVVQPPQNVTFPTNCCGGVNYAGFGGGCNG